ncbi:MAG: hypothetical protein NDJ72_09670 [Elusimicrobia bacterium]|nr:hypothetical protein [Elusimicrobiota bacterium]
MNPTMTASLRSALKAVFHAFLGAIPDEWAIQAMYFRRFGRFANLSRPQTLNEKINWRKLHQRDPRFTLFTDKVAVKEEVARLLGKDHIIPTLWSGERPEDIPFGELEPPYVIKVNHGVGKHTFVRHPEDVDKGAIISALNERLKHSYGRATRQWAYDDIKGKILIERLLDIFEDDAPEDYKFFVYHGRAHFIQVELGRFGKHRTSFYDRAWNKLPMTTASPDIDRPLLKPPYLDELIVAAEKIGSIFDFVSVDLYYAENKVYFGETTFYPGAGYSKKNPSVWDYKMGEPWILPRNP